MSAERTKFAALDDLRGAVRIAKAASIGVTGNAPRIERAEKAIAAVAELVDVLGGGIVSGDRIYFDERKLRVALAALRGGAK